MSAVTSCIGQRKWRWFLHKSQRESVVGGGDRRKKLLREFEVFDDSSRGLLGSVKFFGKIGFRLVSFSVLNSEGVREADIRPVGILPSLAPRSPSYRSSSIP